MEANKGNDPWVGFRTVATGVVIMALPMALIWICVIMSKVTAILRLLEAGIQCK